MLALFLMLWQTLVLAAHSHVGTKRSFTGLGTPKIDTHVHIYPGFYREAAIAAGQVPGPNGNSYHPEWSIESHLAFMDENNIEKSIVSCAGGTVLLANDTAAGVALTRRFNDFTADMKRTYPGRFGFFASLPLPSVEDTLAEIDRALDELDADGFVFLSNFQGLYAGDPKLAPVYEKLNQRDAVLFIHPVMPCPINTPNEVNGEARLNYMAPLMNAYPGQTLEFIFDTTRTVFDLIMTGTAAAYGRVKWIVPHCGSTLPSIMDRFLRITSLAGPKIGSDREVVPYSLQNATELLQRQFWFDLAGFAMPNQIHNMRRLFGADKFTYGSDIPFTAIPGSLGLTREMNQTLPELFNDDEIAMIFRGNALKLLSAG